MYASGKIAKKECPTALFCSYPLHCFRLTSVNEIGAFYWWDADSSTPLPSEIALELRSKSNGRALSHGICMEAMSSTAHTGRCALLLVNRRERGKFAGICYCSSVSRRVVARELFGGSSERATQAELKKQYSFVVSSPNVRTENDHTLA